MVTLNYTRKLEFASSQDEAMGESCIPGLECAWLMQSIKEVKMFGAGKSRLPRRTVDENWVIWGPLGLGRDVM